MTKLYSYTLIVFLLFMTSAFCQNSTIEGEWKFTDYVVEIDVSCDCSAEEDALVTADIYKSLREEVNTYMRSETIKFDNNNRVVGTLMDSKIDGTYTIKNDSVILSYEENISEEYTLISTMDENKLVRRIIGDVEKPVYVKNLETSDYGWIEIAFIGITVELTQVSNSE